MARRETRLYSLFELTDKGWKRIHPFAFRKSYAIRFFQSALLAPYLEPSGRAVRCLKVVKGDVS